MKTSMFNYNLPEELIAKYPPKNRGDARLMVLDRQSGKIAHRNYSDISDYIKPDDVAVLNETKVQRVRVFGQIERSGRQVEILFLQTIQYHGENIEDYEYWYCLVGRAKYVKTGDYLLPISDKTISDELKLKVVERKPGEEGFIIGIPRGQSAILFEQFGHVPLPPYMRRPDEEIDKLRYNTVFARNIGSVAAPTASLNVTPELIDRIKSKNAQIAYVELTVSWGTFAPVRTENVEDYKIHSENIEIPEESVQIINDATQNNREVWAFGTTAARALESVSDNEKRLKPFTGETNLFIYPGYKWKIVDHLVTNFHAPYSSLLMLTASFAGYDFMMEAYQEAIREKYNFLSYGDSMLII